MISNNELVHLLDEATHLANLAYVMGRRDENTGDDSASLYDKMDGEMKAIGKELLPVARGLVKELKKTNPSIAKELAQEYAEAMRFVGCAGERGYEAMLDDKEHMGEKNHYGPSTPFSYGIFGENVKRLCKMAAQERGLSIETVEELPFNEMIQEKIRQEKEFEKELMNHD